MSPRPRPIFVGRIKLIRASPLPWTGLRFFNVRSGLADFVTMPSTAAALGPRAFVVGLGRGTGSLAGNLSRGTLLSFSSLAYVQRGWEGWPELALAWRRY